MKNKQMPIMSDENKFSLPGEVEESSSLGGLKVSEMEVKQNYIQPGEDVTSIVNIPLAPKNGISVIATRPGFYGQQRLKIGDKFIVKSFEQLGEWMKCEDSVLEKKKLEFLKNKKAKK